MTQALTPEQNKVWVFGRENQKMTERGLGHACSLQGAAQTAVDDGQTTDLLPVRVPGINSPYDKY